MAHYAKNHTGFVVEFCIPQEIECPQNDIDEYLLKVLFPLEVDYSETKPVIDPADCNDINLQKQFLTKSDDWQYESEWRVIDTVRGSGIHQYERTKILKSVIAGVEMEKNDYIKLRSAVQSVNSELNINVGFYKAEKAKGKFALTVPKRSDLSC